MYNIDNYVCTGLICANLKWKISSDEKIMYKVLCVPRLISIVHEMDCLGKETVSVPGRSGAQSSVASTRLQQFKEGVLSDSLQLILIFM